MESFDHFLTNGLKTVIKNMQPYEFELLNGEKLSIAIEDCSITPPRVTSQIDVKERRIFPSEARQRAVTYTGNCTMTLGWQKNGARQPSIDFDLGPIPIMIRVSQMNSLSSKFELKDPLYFSRSLATSISSLLNKWLKRTSMKPIGAAISS